MNIEYRFAVNVTPKPGILDPQGRAVEASLPHLGITGVASVRVGRRIELTVAADDEATARATVERLAGELLSNPLIEAFGVERLAATSSTSSAHPAISEAPAGTVAPAGTPAPATRDGR